ncbi:MAG: hypothetical protein ACKVPJ_05115, partial [Chitinophagales bacterium]
TLNSMANFLQDKIVVLFLEMKNTLLKNCTENDCDDKGMKIEFNLKPLLVLKTDVDKYISSVKDKELSIGPVKESNKEFKSIALKRFNVPLTTLTNSDAVINSFLNIVDTTTLKTLSDNLNACYNQNKPILLEFATNPFTTVFTTLTSKLDEIKKTNPQFTQYYYDWIDDLLKAYFEFRDKAFSVQAQCCPDEKLFPLHLMLGRATENTLLEMKMSYREYFIYSQLFNNQKDLLGELQFLFRRMVMMMKNFGSKKPSTSVKVKITPSKYLDKPLSERCIPYYYEPEGLYQCWNWLRAKRGNASFNLSYNAADYNTSDIAINPLLYDIEQYNFFRIEGHIGKSFSSALAALDAERKSKNLPFDVITLSTATIAKFSSAGDYDCLFKDLESAYAVLCAELDCYVKEVVNIASSYKYDNTVFAGIDLTNIKSDFPFFFVGNTFSNFGRSGVTKPITTKSAFKAPGLNQLTLTTNNQLAKVYDTGAYLNKAAGTLGEIYVPGLVAEIFAGLDLSSNTSVTSYLTKFISAIENVLASALNMTLEEFDEGKFTTAFKALVTQANTWIAKTDTDAELTAGIASLKELDAEFKFERYITLVNELPYSCLDDKFTALKAEYNKRLKEINALRTLSKYMEKHSGIEHKAGVPKGGTFILVYHETADEKQRITVDKTTVDTLSKLGLLAAKETVIATPSLAANIPFVLTSEKSGGLFEIETSFANNLRTNLIPGIGKVKGPRDVKKTQFQFAENTVIADFYLPYICCSDCPPVEFIVVPNAPAIVSLEIELEEYCNTDTKTYPIKVSPEGGTLTASRGGIVAGKFEFTPLNIAEGINTLTYTLPDGKSTSVEVIIHSADAGFTMNIVEHPTVRGSHVVTLKAKDANATSHKWNVSQTQFTGQVISLPFETNSITLDYNTVGLTGGNDLIIELTVNKVLDTGGCSDTEEYKLTESIFFKHVGKGEFDNTTRE